MGRGRNDARADGTAVGWSVIPMTTVINDGANGTFQALGNVNTVTGPTNGLEILQSGITQIEFLSPPLAADVTISGTITFNLWGHEFSMNDNAGPQCIIERVDSTGAIVSTVANSEKGTELPVTTDAVQNWTATPTSTTFNRGDRIRLRILINDVGVMASGGSGSFTNDATTTGTQGDTWIQFTENLTFETTAPAGSTLYLTDTNSDVTGANLEKKALTTRGSGSVDAPTSSVAGWTAPVIATASAGGTQLEWYTDPVTAFTLGGMAKFNIRAKYDAGPNALIWCEIAVVNGDGSGAVVWGTGLQYSGTLGTTDSAQIGYVAGDDIAVTTGQRIRIRIGIDDITQAMISGKTITFSYNGGTAAAAGDSWITLPQTITISGPGPKAITPAQVSAFSTLVGAIRRLAAIITGQIAATSTVSGGGYRVLTPITPTTNILATSSVAGSIVRLRVVTLAPASISATSTMSGSVRVSRAIKPAQVSATSTMSGSTRATRAVVPAQIGATSAVSGSVRATRRITPASITAATTVTGVVTPIRRVAPTTISAASTVSGAVTKGGGVKQLLPGAISASSTVSGSVGVRRILVPASVAATASVSGTVRILRAILPGQVSATSTVAGSLRVTRRIIPAQVAATSTVSGVVTRIGATRLISGTLSATSTVSGQVSTIRKVAGVVAATATVSGSLTRIVRPSAGTINATTILSGSIRVTRAVLPAQILATTSVTGAVRILRKIAPATISATSVVSGNLFKLGQKPIIGANVQAISTVAGNIRVTRRISGQINATSSVVGTVTKRARVAGVIQATATVSGSVRILRGVLPALIQAASTVTGSTRVTRKISGAVVATSAVSGSIIRSGKITGTITATSTVAGTIRPLRGIFPATILASSTVSGKVVRRISIAPSLINSTSTLSGRVVVVRRIVPGLINSTTTLSGRIVVVRRVVASLISSTTIIFGAVGVRRGIAGNILATSTVTGLVQLTGIARIVPSPVFATSVVSGSVFRYTPTVTYSHAGTGTIFDRVATGAALVGSGNIMVGTSGTTSGDGNNGVTDPGEVMSGKTGVIS